MNLKVGIVGMPNSGKSALFNALLKRQVSPEGRHPFTTISPYTGVVAVPDERLDRLAALVKPERVVPATVTFVDIAGLLKNAHRGEGLGNEFLGYIRDAAALVHVIRAFDDAAVPHVMGTVDPVRDREIVETELRLAGIDKPTTEWINRDIEGFDRVGELIGECYRLLSLRTFYTIKGGVELHAWPVREGTTAREAAERVHTDFVKRFIKAQVVGAQALCESGGWRSAKDRGLVRLEGREYAVADGDVIEFAVGT